MLKGPMRRPVDVPRALVELDAGSVASCSALAGEATAALGSAAGRQVPRRPVPEGDDALASGAAVREDPRFADPPDAAVRADEADRALELERWRMPPRRPARDTTGAGDSFNAGWLSSRAAGLSVEAAIARAAAVAAEVVTYPGAIMPRAAMPTFEAQN